MSTSRTFAAHTSWWHVRVPTVSVPLHLGEPCAARGKWIMRPLRAINNQHSHLGDEYVRMEAQLLQQALQTSHASETLHKEIGHVKHHVFHDTDLHPYQPQPQRHVYHEGQGPYDSARSHIWDSATAVELSYQYSSNIFNYPTEVASLPKALFHRARVLDYNHPAALARDLILLLLGGGKLLLELPDEPTAVSSLMAALGQAASKLRTVGLATALDPVHDPVPATQGCSSTCHSSGSNAGHMHPTTGHANNHHQHHHHHHHGASSGGGSPSSSYDSASGGGNSAAAAGTRRPHDGGGGGGGGVAYIFCARAVPMPSTAGSTSGDTMGAAATYTVGCSMGQEVFPVGPSVGVHALMPVLLSAILRDGLVTLRCCWFDEELDVDSFWQGDNGRTAAGASNSSNQDQDCTEQGDCDGSSLWSNKNSTTANNSGSSSSSSSRNTGRSGSPGGSPHVAADGHSHSRVAAAVPTAAWASASGATAPAGSLVRVPCVLRAIFKLDRQLRGLDLGGLVVLPHTFARSCRDSRTQVLHLDLVIA